MKCDYRLDYPWESGEPARHATCGSNTRIGEVKKEECVMANDCVENGTWGDATRSLALATIALEKTLLQYERSQKWRLAAHVSGELEKLCTRNGDLEAAMLYHHKSTRYIELTNETLTVGGDKYGERC